jgi:hypothetical protein
VEIFGGGKYLQIFRNGSIRKYLEIFVGGKWKVLVGHTHTLVLLALPVGIGFSGFFFSTSRLIHFYSTIGPQ